jgi:DNA-binding LytR/AlgR family response regulator
MKNSLDPKIIRLPKPTVIDKTNLDTKESVVGQNTKYIRNGKQEIPCHEVKYIESAGNYSMIWMTNHSHVCTSLTLKRYSVPLSEHNCFMLVRKGLLVNMTYCKKIREYDGTKCLELSTGEVFKLSRRIGQRLIDQLKKIN